MNLVGLRFRLRMIYCALTEPTAAMVGNLGMRPCWHLPASSAPPANAFGYDDEPAIMEAVRQVKSHSMSSYERLATLWQQVCYLDRYALPGALVECGVARGGSVGMMALAHRAFGKPQRHLHLFDSFEGLPEPQEGADGEKARTYANGRMSGKLASIGQCVGTLDDNRKFLEEKIAYPKNLLHYHIGWFQNTVPTDAPEIGPIGLLRLDGDWYESTKLCLDHLFPLVIPGGVVVIDDYGCWEGCRKAVDEFLAHSSFPVLLHHIDNTARVFVKLGA